MLGMRLVAVVGGMTVSGAVVETEAYRGSGDPASHAYRGRTRRNEVMYGEPGHAYVYFSYGFHNLLNVTTEPVGSPGAVLIRALEPLDGIRVMAKNRGTALVDRLVNGPGNLTRALGVDRRHNGEDLITSERLFLEMGERPERIGVSRRVGISQGTSFGWRFFDGENRYVSKGRPAALAPRNHN